MANTIEALLAVVTALTAEVEDLKGQLADLTATPVPSAPAKAPKGKKAAPKGKKGGNGSKSRTIRTVNLDAFSEAIGEELTGWTLVDVLDALRDKADGGSAEVGNLDYVDGEVIGLPEGWGFGSKSLHYLANGEFPS